MKIHKEYLATLFIVVLLVCKVVCEPDLSIERNKDKPWHLLEMGKIKIEQGEFGEALNYVNYARAVHKREIEKKYNYLFNSIKSKPVKKVGDGISAVYAILRKRENYDACKILDEIFLTHPPIFFDKSISNLMEWLKKRDAFPESDLLTAEIFFAEAEYEQAMHYYKLAWANRMFLEIPDVRFKIIYSMANTAKLLNKFDDQEKYLLLILTEDPVYGTTSLESQTLKAMVNTLFKEDTVEKFFLLYRHKNKIALKAYLDLTNIYMDAANYERALTTSALASIIVTTNLDDELLKADYTHKYKDFTDLLKKLKNKNEILNWAESKNFWRIFLNLADCLKAGGQNAQANDLYKKLARYLPSIKYAQEAAYKENM